MGTRMDIPTDGPASRQIYRQPARITDSHIDRKADMKAERQIGRCKII